MFNGIFDTNLIPIFVIFNGISLTNQKNDSLFSNKKFLFLAEMLHPMFFLSKKKSGRFWMICPKKYFKLATLPVPCTNPWPSGYPDILISKEWL